LYPTSVTFCEAVQFKTVDDDVVAEVSRFVIAVRLVVTVTASVADKSSIPIVLTVKV
jgi:hypothetical protein